MLDYDSKHISKLPAAYFSFSALHGNDKLRTVLSVWDSVQLDGL